MTPNFSAMEKIVGAFIGLTFLTFLGVVFLVGQGQNWFREHYVYFALFKEGYNLQPGAKVKLLRTDIGYVTAVELTKENQAKVTLRILADYASRIRADSRAAIDSPTIIGSEYVSVTPGSSQAAQIKPDGEIPATEAKKIGDYLEDFDLKTKMEKINDILASLSTILKELSRPEGALFKTLANVETLTGTLARGEGTLGRLVTKDDLYAKLEGQVLKLEEILAYFRDTAENIRSMSTDVAGLTAEARAALPPILTSLKTGLPPVMASLRTTLPPILNNLRTALPPILSGLRKDLPELTASLKAGLPALLVQVDGILKKVDASVALLQEAMQEAPDISRQARMRLRDVAAILESVKQNILIRGNLPPPPVPKTHGLELRGD